MLDSLLDPILPIFAIMGAGFALQRAGVFDADHARAINRYVFYVATPTLLFSVVSGAEFEHMDFDVLALYLLAECSLYAAVAVLLNRVFKRGLQESILLGMTAVFVNHVFFVLPIAERLYGTEAVQPIAAPAVFDRVEDVEAV